MFKRYTGDGIGHKDTCEDTCNLYKKLLAALGLSESDLPTMSSNLEEEFAADLLDASGEPPLLSEASDGEFLDSDVKEDEGDDSDLEENEASDAGSGEENDDDDLLSDGDYFELNEAEEDDGFDDEGLCGFSAL